MVDGVLRITRAKCRVCADLMAVGVASANSILLVTFAREQQLAGKIAFESAIDAGHTRIRPVLMRP